MLKSKSYFVALASFCVFFLYGCGGGSSDSVPTPDPVTPVNTAPVAKAALSHSNNRVGGILQMDASESTDPEQDMLSYNWQLLGPDGIAVPLSNNTAVKTEVTTTQAGVYKAELKVTDSKGLSSTTQQSISISISPDPEITVEIVGVTSALQGQLLSYTAVVSSLELEQPQYLWQLEKKPELSQTSLGQPQGLTTTLQPDVPGDYALKLTLTDSLGKSLTAKLTLNVSALTTNAAPTAIIEVEKNFIKINEKLSLSASKSSDPERAPLSYQWEILQFPAGSAFNLSAPTAVNTDFITDSAGTYLLQLTVSDGEKSAQKQLNITAESNNQAPVAEVSSSAKKIRPGDTVRLTAKATDPEGAPLTYQWKLGIKPRNSQAQLSAATAIETDLTTDLEGEYVIWLQASDGEKKSFPRGLKIEAYQNFAPEVTIQPFQPLVAVGEARSLTALATDFEGSPLSYLWTVDKAPAGAQVNLSQPTQASTDFSANLVGEYYLMLVVTDNQGKASAPLKLMLQVK